MFTIIRSSKLKDIESRLSQLEAVSGRVAMKEINWDLGHLHRMIRNILKKLDKNDSSN